MAVWDKYGLVSSRFVSGRAADPRYSSLPRAVRFRLSLEEKGGLFALFGHFLTGRADLLPSPHLRQLRKIKAAGYPAHRPELDRALAGRVTGLQPLGAAPGADLYSGLFRNEPVVVEHYYGDSGTFDPASWKAFTREVRILDGELETRVAQRRTLDHFEEWISLSRDLNRKRAILENLQTNPPGGVVRFPRLVQELQSDVCLAYSGAAAESPALELDPDQPHAEKKLQRLVEGLLEQSLLISLVDAEMRLDNYLLNGGDALEYRRLPTLAPVPVEWHYELLQYMASTIAGQSPRALHMLSRICASQDHYAGEQRLMRELSGLQPELKINLITPESVTSLENYWRTLANTGMRPPLFLELFHRQWTLLGQYNGEVAPAADVIAESLWPVLARILRLRFGELLSLSKGREWAANSGLMMLTAARQAGLLFEQIRDNDLAIVTDQQEFESSEARLNRRTMSLVRSAFALAVFLLAVYFSSHATEGWVKLVAGATAAISAVALALFVARIE